VSHVEYRAAARITWPASLNCIHSAVRVPLWLVAFAAGFTQQAVVKVNPPPPEILKTGCGRKGKPPRGVGSRIHPRRLH
jgi:hypothetical protein